MTSYQRMKTDHIMQLVGYHVSCIMSDQLPRITCSLHADMPVFDHALTEHNRIHVRNLYMREVAKLIASI
jgi:hypothetical protein